MKTVQHSIFVEAPTRAVFDLVSETERMPDWVPSMEEVRNVKGTGKGKSYDWTYRMAGVRLKGRTEVVDIQPNRHLETKSTGGVNSTWSYRFEDKDNGCQVTLKVDYEIPAPVLGRLAENVVHRRNQRELELGLSNLRDIAEHRKAAAPA